MKYFSIVRELLMRRFTCIINFIIQFFFIFSVQGVYAQFESRIHSAFTRTLPYQLFIPENYSTAEYYPLILELHGAGGGGPDALEDITWIEDSIQQQHPSFVVFPQDPNIAAWWFKLDIVNSLLVSLIDEFSIDTTRLYITGYSMGGWGTTTMILTSPLHFAAAMTGGGGAENELWPLTSYIPPIWNFHGINDGAEPVKSSRDMIRAIEDVIGIEAIYPDLKNGVPSPLTEDQLDSLLQAGARLIYSETLGTHGTTANDAYTNPKVKEWMFSHQTDFVLPEEVSPILQKTREPGFEHVGTNPVLGPGNFGSWEAYAVSEPCVIKDGDTLKMWYVGWKSSWGNTTQIGYAWSLDGVNWQRYANNPVMTTSLPWEGVRINHVSVIKDNDIYRMWYSAGDRLSFSTSIGYAWSEDGLTWTKHPDAVLLPGAPGEWDHFNIAVGTVIKEDDIYKLWYHGGTYYTGMKIGYATALDGINWTKYNDPQTKDMAYHISDPVVSVGRFAKDWDFHGVWYSMVYHDSKGYEMWYSGSTVGIVGFLHYAVSEDGIIWSKSESNPVLYLPPDWTEKTGYIGGSVIKDKSEYHFWYSQYYYDTGVSVIGYVRDLGNIARTDSFTICHSSRRAALDTLNITAWVNNPHADNLEVKAQFVSKDSLIDYLPLSNVDSNVWSGQWPVAEGERTYSVSIQTTDVDSSTVHESNEGSNKYFTTVGPLKLAGFEINSTDSVVNPGDRLWFRFSIKNWGKVTTAENITAKITVLDTFAFLVRGDELNFENIPAEETIESSNLILIAFKESSYPQNPYAVKFAAEIKSDGNVFWHDTTSITVGIGDIEAGLPESFSLAQNYPNPFNPKTVIRYSLPVTSHLELSIYNILGQKVATLVNKKQPAGNYQVQWDANSFASGVYLYRLSAGNFVETKKLVLLK